MNKKELNLDDVKKIQMGVLSAIDEFCNSNGIKYSLGEGSLLGAIRHQGYIPWDDDIDIVLLRDDYCRLISEFPDNYKGHYKIASLERNDEWIRPYAVAYDDNTVLVEAGREKMSIGIKIDIFPIDNLPSDINEKKYFNKLYFWWLYYIFSGGSKGSNFIKTVIIKILYLSTSLYSRRKQAIHIQRLFSKYRSHKSEMVFEWTPYKRSLSVFPISIFNEYKYYPFEDKCYMGIIGADKYLTSLYGNYMQLPPVEDRKSHHVYKAYLK